MRSETSKRAEFWFAKAGIAINVSQACIAAACLNPAFKSSADYFANRSLYFLAKAFAEMALRPIPPFGVQRN